MKKIHLVSLGLLLVTGSVVKAQTADEIITKHIDAIGGAKVISGINSQVTESEISVMGSSLSATSTVLVGKGFKNTANFNGQEIIQVVTPTSGWMINPLQGMVDPQAMPDDQVKSGQSILAIGGDLYDYKAKGSKAELSGRENLNGVNTYKLKLTGKDGKDATYYFDPTTYYLVKMERTVTMGGQDVPAYSLFSNFKKTESGLVVPYTTVSNQGFEMTISINKVQFNVPVDQKIFEMPKS